MLLLAVWRLRSALPSHGPASTPVSRTSLSDLGSTAYQLFDRAVVLDQPMRQSGQEADQILFRDILLRLRNGQTIEADWRHLMERTPSKVDNLISFQSALHLHPTTEAVVEHNLSKLHASGQPVATIVAVHTGANASQASPDDAGGLYPVICMGTYHAISGLMWVWSMVPWVLSQPFATRQDKLPSSTSLHHGQV